MRWGVKKKSNDELRQRFVNLTVAQAKAIDLTLPDPDLAYDEATENWKFGAIDWDEFWRVREGQRPCNRERLAARRKAHDDGAWVRVAAAAYAAKQRAQQAADGSAWRAERSVRGDRPPRPPTIAVAAVGSVHPAAQGRSRTSTRAASTPPTAEQALQNARDVYARRGEA